MAHSLSTPSISKPKLTLFLILTSAILAFYVVGFLSIIEHHRASPYIEPLHTGLSNLLCSSLNNIDMLKERIDCALSSSRKDYCDRQIVRDHLDYLDSLGPLSNLLLLLPFLFMILFSIIRRYKTDPAPTGNTESKDDAELTCDTEPKDDAELTCDTESKDDAELTCDTAAPSLKIWFCVILMLSLITPAGCDSFSTKLRNVDIGFGYTTIGAISILNVAAITYPNPYCSRDLDRPEHPGPNATCKELEMFRTQIALITLDLIETPTQCPLTGMDVYWFSMHCALGFFSILAYMVTIDETVLVFKGCGGVQSIILKVVMGMPFFMHIVFIVMTYEKLVNDGWHIMWGFHLIILLLNLGWLLFQILFYKYFDHNEVDSESSTPGQE